MTNSTAPALAELGSFDAIGNFTPSGLSKPVSTVRAARAFARSERILDCRLTLANGRVEAYCFTLGY